MKIFLLSLLTVTTIWADAHIFVYHRFGDSRHPSTNTSIEELRKEFDYFKQNGYEVVPLSKLVETIKKKESVPDNWVVLTIDDNYKSFYQNGLSVFKEYGYPFSLFVYVGAVDKKYSDFTTWEELKEIGKYGSLEFHSYGHEHMTQISDEQIRQDFEKGLNLFEKNLGIKPKYFSYPYGEFNERVKEISKNYGFEAIVNQNTGAIAHFSDPYDLDRCALVGETNLQKYLKYKALDAQWIEPKEYPKDDILLHVKVKFNNPTKHGGVYLSGHGYRDVAVINNELNVKMDKKLTQERSRIMVSSGNKISTKLLIKDTYGTH
ncbi:MAG: polysaccharide deacetylase family protein [Sulfurospirillaceae bacterium]|nr:polysaccharide deacetylase family protein [Sulfurospirillaceae bacterium]